MNEGEIRLRLLESLLVVTSILIVFSEKTKLAANSAAIVIASSIGYLSIMRLESRERDFQGDKILAMCGLSIGLGVSALSAQVIEGTGAKDSIPLGLLIFFGLLPIRYIEHFIDWINKKAN